MAFFSLFAPSLRAMMLGCSPYFPAIPLFVHPFPGWKLIAAPVIVFINTPLYGVSVFFPHIPPQGVVHVLITFCLWPGITG